jgi:Fungal Zn(2)-Cys(6) binuclear cluster domain
MDIEGLINTRDRSTELHLATTSFSLPPSTSRSHDPTSATSFTFPDLSPTAIDNTGFPTPDFSYQPRKRSSQDGTLGGPHPSPPSRKKSSGTNKGEQGRMSFAKDYPRRRALQACQICRARKTKCDNERPNCGSCEALGVECNYNEAPASKYFPFLLKRVADDRLDQGSVMVLDRLARIEGILADQTARLTQLQSREHLSLTQLSTSPLSVMDTSSSTTLPPEQPHQVLLRPQLSTLNVPPGGHTSVDAVFGLPIILNILPKSRNEVRRQSYLIQSDLEDTMTAPARHPTTPNLSREVTTKLIDAYLSIVYPKNPIINRTDLRQMHLELLSNGPRWDTKTCLVFIILALGAIAIVDHDPNPVPAGANHTDYLDAALQRFGFVLMRTDIEAIQTTYLFGYPASSDFIDVAYITCMI